jgi:predicted MFS family arabinose efflux permease
MQTMILGGSEFSAWEKWNMSTTYRAAAETMTSETAIESRNWVIPYIAALFAMMMLQISNLGFPPLMPGIQKSWDLSFSQVGLFTGVNGLASMLMAIPAGLLIQRFGEKKVLSTGLVVVAAGLSLVALSSTFSLGMVGRTVWQFGYKATFVSIITALSLTIPLHLKASGMCVNGALSSLATAIGAPFGTILALHYGWKGGMWGYAALALIGCAVFSWFYRPVRKILPSKKVEPIEDASPRPASAFKTPIVWVLSLLMCFGTMLGISLTFFMPMALTSMFNLNATDAATIQSMAFGIGVPVVLFSGVIADRINNRRLVLASIMLINTVLPLMMLTTNPTVFRVSAMMILSLGLSVPNLLYALAGEVLAGREVGNIMGTIGFGGGVAAYFGPQMLGLLRDVTGGFAAGWYLMAAVSAISFMIVIFLKIK